MFSTPLGLWNRFILTQTAPKVYLFYLFGLVGPMIKGYTYDFTI
eukprot:SAG11_NODE_2667_length_3114_cov_3.233167_2_plen_44_part_00